jgi:aminoglycoside/choline kinase family phosphotransferase
MALGGDEPGILDFQDAVVGPISYDLVSLLRDCYVAWPETQVDRWVGDYLARAIPAGLLPPSEAGRFRRWFDFMGMQRHLKAVGIFSRLNLRDGKPGYLAEIPRTLNYVSAVSRRYPEFADFAAFLGRGEVATMIGENLA